MGAAASRAAKRRRVEGARWSPLAELPAAFQLPPVSSFDSIPGVAGAQSLLSLLMFFYMSPHPNLNITRAPDGFFVLHGMAVKPHPGCSSCAEHDSTAAPQEQRIHGGIAAAVPAARMGP